MSKDTNPGANKSPYTNITVEHALNAPGKGWDINKLKLSVESLQDRTISEPAKTQADEAARSSAFKKLTSIVCEMTKADSNHDGFLSKTELQSNPNLKDLAGRLQKSIEKVAVTMSRHFEASAPLPGQAPEAGSASKSPVRH